MTAVAEPTAELEAIPHRFTRGDGQYSTYEAAAAPGKTINPIFLCRHLDEEALRHEIHERLNVVEAWNPATGLTFFLVRAVRSPTTHRTRSISP